ncbi:MAG: hypothetical protein FWD49_07690 [Firmicutes bacterium]|nr:hypothetical protein [Bacillota bacterium]
MRVRKINYYHYICIAITVALIAMAVFAHSEAFLRLWQALKDLWTSICYLVLSVFGIEYDGVTVTALPPPSATAPFPETPKEFASNWGDYWKLFASEDNLLNYLFYAIIIFAGILQVLSFVFPLVLFCYFAIKKYFSSQNNNYAKDTQPLKRVKRFSAKTYLLIKRWLVGLIAFLKEKQAYLAVWIITLLLMFNILSVVISFLAFYLYFSISFDVGSLYTHTYKTAIDLRPLFSFWPAYIIMIPLALAIFNRSRKRTAYKRLNRMESINTGFVASLPLVVLICNSMGAGKTTLMTDMALSLQAYFRYKAYELLLENDLKFPYFPYINLENEIKVGMARGYIRNLATVRRFIRSKHKKFTHNPCKEKCFGYDFKRYGTEYYDGLKLLHLFDVLESYACLYLIYSINTCYFISNYSVRDDSVKIDMGNFPMWDTDFFKRDPRFKNSIHRFAHILDYEMLRLSKRILDDPTVAGALDFGIIIETEAGKNWGNYDELKTVNATAEETNQKNDGHNMSLRMMRHPATVDGFCFRRYLMDEQRPVDLSKDMRALVTVIHVGPTSEERLTIRPFFVEELLHDSVDGRFRRFYEKHRLKRGDNTLLCHIFKTVASKLHGYYKRTYNVFGYKVSKLKVGSGADIENRAELISHDYYIMPKKIYSNRFNTACYQAFFEQGALNAKWGLQDFPTYASLTASPEELDAQHSYFIPKMKGITNGIGARKNMKPPKPNKSNTTEL